LAKAFDELQLVLVHPSGYRYRNEPEWIQESRHLLLNYPEP
jgi:hypothetical protein